MIDAARESGATVVYATDCHDEGDAGLKKWPPHSMRGTHGGEIVPDLTPQAGDVVLEKQTYSAFQSTNLDEILKEKGIGFTSLVCIPIAVYTPRGMHSRGVSKWSGY